ncbi:hypothetical protein GCM10027418_00530 [Mariniluteicoccus endophyticus]
MTTAVRPGTTYAPPTGQPRPVRGPLPPQAAPTGRLKDPLRGTPTPRALQILLVVSILTTLLFGAVATSQLFAASRAMNEATRHTAQLTRIQAIEANLLSADATATNAFLVGGLESSEQRNRYVTAMSEVARLIPEAGQAQPADQDVLRALNEEVVTYAAIMEQARANNRQGFPLGSAYLSDAGDHLRGRAMPLLDSLVSANDGRVRTTLERDRTAVAVVSGLIALLALLATMYVVAIRFRRILNVGLATALALVLVATLTATSSLASTQTAADRIQSGPLAIARAAGAARVHAYDAKAYESLTLIARSRGGENEALWALANLRAKRAMKAIPNGQVRASLQRDWSSHVVSHRKIRELDSDGRWDLARTAATGTGEGSSNATFIAFDRAATQAAATAGDDAVRQLGRLHTPLVWSAVLTVLMSLGAVVAAIAGINKRLKEYA